MNLTQWELPVNQADLPRVLALYPVQRRRETTAVRAFKVGELDQRDRRVHRSEGRMSRMIEVHTIGSDQDFNLVCLRQVTRELLHPLFALFVPEELPYRPAQHLQRPPLHSALVGCVPGRDVRLGNGDPRFDLVQHHFLDLDATRRCLGFEQPLAHRLRNARLQQLIELATVLMLERRQLIADELFEVGARDGHPVDHGKRTRYPRGRRHIGAG